jgi:hypothetical protein
MGTHLPSLKCPEVRASRSLTTHLIYIHRSLQSLCPQYMKHGSLSHVEILTILTHALLKISRGAALACQQRIVDILCKSLKMALHSHWSMI